jgi:hypothetical protein
MSKKIKLYFLYIFVPISVALALFIMYKNSLDFFDPNSLSFQMLDLTKGQIYILDLTEIWVYAALLVLLIMWITKKNIKWVTITSVSIWVFTLIEFLIENSLRFKV